MIKKRMKTNANSVTIRICISAIASIVFSLVLTCLFTGAINNNVFGDSVINVVIFGIRTISVFIGCLIGHKTSQNKMVVTGIVVGQYILFLLFLGVILYDGTFENFGIGMVSCLVGAFGALLIGMTHIKRKNIIHRYNK